MIRGLDFYDMRGWFFCDDAFTMTGQDFHVDRSTFSVWHLNSTETVHLCKIYTPEN